MGTTAGSSTKYNRFYIVVQDAVDPNDNTVGWVCPVLAPIQN